MKIKKFNENLESTPKELIIEIFKCCDEIKDKVIDVDDVNTLENLRVNLRWAIRDYLGK